MRVVVPIAWGMLVSGALAEDANPVSAQPAGGSEAWVAHCAALKADPSVLGFYTFAGVTTNSPKVANLSGAAKPWRELVLNRASYWTREGEQKPEPTMKIVPGRRTGEQAVQLDLSRFSVDAFPSPTKAFGAEVWFRTEGPGEAKGVNKSEGGCVLQVGNGYYDGWRLMVSWPTNAVAIQVGTGKTSAPFGVSAQKVFEEDTWTHLAFSWDGSVLTLYVDGSEVASETFADKAMARADPRLFCVGGTGAGTGTAILDIDEVVFYDRALTAEEVKKHAAVK
jgi:hypothetical protein